MNKNKKSIDTTFLSLDHAEQRGFIHRDYLAHCLRWTHVVKFLQGKAATADILDIGCGRELPMAKMLHSSRNIPHSYTGVDYGPILDVNLGRMKFELHPKTDFAKWARGMINDGPQKKFTHIVCFEMLEHVEPAHCIRVLKRMRKLMTDNGVTIISTPCWNEKDCAANHVNEIKFEALGSVLQHVVGFGIDKVYGTFASIADYKKDMNNATEKVFNRLRDYYDVNVLSCIMAPLFPAHSRNCLWVLKKNPELITKYKFPKLNKVKEPWSSSSKWKDMLPDSQD